MRCPSCNLPSPPGLAGAAFCPYCGTPLKAVGSVAITPPTPTPAEDVIPDVVGDVIGWRAWYIVKTGRMVRLKSLMGAFNGVLWTPGKWLEAKCPYGEKIPNHQPPVNTCSCGFYAALDRNHLVSMGYNAYHDEANRVVGEVQMSGKVIVHSQGYKAQRVRPHRLWVPYERWELKPLLEDTYGVEVGFTNVFKAQGR